MRFHTPQRSGLVPGLLQQQTPLGCIGTYHSIHPEHWACVVEMNQLNKELKALHMEHILLEEGATQLLQASRAANATILRNLLSLLLGGIMSTTRNSPSDSRTSSSSCCPMPGRHQHSSSSAAANTSRDTIPIPIPTSPMNTRPWVEGSSRQGSAVQPGTTLHTPSSNSAAQHQQSGVGGHGMSGYSMRRGSVQGSNQPQGLGCKLGTQGHRAAVVQHAAAVFGARSSSLQSASAPTAATVPPPVTATTATATAATARDCQALGMSHLMMTLLLQSIGLGTERWQAMKQRMHALDVWAEMLQERWNRAVSRWEAVDQAVQGEAAEVGMGALQQAHLLQGQLLGLISLVG